MVSDSGLQPIFVCLSLASSKHRQSNGLMLLVTHTQLSIEKALIRIAGIILNMCLGLCGQSEINNEHLRILRPFMH